MTPYTFFELLIIIPSTLILGCDVGLIISCGFTEGAIPFAGVTLQIPAEPLPLPPLPEMWKPAPLTTSEMLSKEIIGWMRYFRPWF